MENSNDKSESGFQYTYSASEQQELKRIREKYTDKEEDKMERLRRLDSSVTQKATALALVFGVLGTLVLGMGMSLAMSDFGQMLGLSGETAMLSGVALGVVGAILLSLAYPIYHWEIKRLRKKIAPQMIQLTDELLKR